MASLVVLILNDQVLKVVWPGLVTGKLSDVAGLVVLPLAIQAAVEVWLTFVGRWERPSSRVLLAAIALVGVGFAAIQFWPPAVELYGIALGTAQWPFRAVAALVSGAPTPSVALVAATPDAADLLTLPALGVAWSVGRRRSG